MYIFHKNDEISILAIQKKHKKVSIYSTKSDRTFQTRRVRLTPLQQEATESSKPGETKQIVAAIIK
jgi:hypothetical protein